MVCFNMWFNNQVQLSVNHEQLSGQKWSPHWELRHFENCKYKCISFENNIQYPNLWLKSVSKQFSLHELGSWAVTATYFKRLPVIMTKEK